MTTILTEVMQHGPALWRLESDSFRPSLSQAGCVNLWELKLCLICAERYNMEKLWKGHAFKNI